MRSCTLLFAMCSPWLTCASLVDLDAKSMAAELLDTSTPLFVKFEAPWCGHCKRLSPVWDSLLELDLEGVRLGTVDCTRQDELRMQCAQPALEPAEPIAGTRAQRAASDALRSDGIESYPTLLLFAEGSIRLFSGERSLPELSRFARGGWRQTPEYVPTPLPPPSPLPSLPSELRQRLERLYEMYVPPPVRRVAIRALEFDPASWPPLLRLGASFLVVGMGVQFLVGCYFLLFDRQSLHAHVRTAAGTGGKKAALKPPDAKPKVE